MTKRLIGDLEGRTLVGTFDHATETFDHLRTQRKIEAWWARGETAPVNGTERRAAPKTR